MTREIVFDTETTGLAPEDGHRVVEIGALELVNHVPTGNVFHHYINPRMAMPSEAFAIHGISDADLAGKPYFEDLAGQWIEFIGDAKLVAHNAEFDIKFLNAELARVGGPVLQMTRVVDTLALAKRKFPGAQNNLDALCRRYGVDLSKRVKHGALLDSELLAEVYLELLGGRQSHMLLGAKSTGGIGTDGAAASWSPARPRPAPRPVLLSAEERARHTDFIATLEAGSIWPTSET